MTHQNFDPLTTHASLPVEAPGDAGVGQRLDAAVDRAIAEHRIVGAVVLVARGGRIIYRRAAGFADREAEIPMREDAIFLLASLTKPIVTAAAMRLVEQGRMGLADPVTKWLPDFRPRTAQGNIPVITTRHLLTHTAGLTYVFMEPADGPYHQLEVSSGFDRVGPSLEENIRRTGIAPLLYEPGADWGYSMAMDVLGAIVARICADELPDVVKRLVTGPLAMNDTGFHIVDRNRLVTHYGDGRPEPVRMAEEQIVSVYGLPISFAPKRLLDARAYPSGGAGTAGTAGDFLIFLEAIRTGGGGVVKPETVMEMMAVQVRSENINQGSGWGFGFGAAVLFDPARSGTPQSAGTWQWDGAYGHKWFVDPERELTVVALSNTAFEGMNGVFTTDVRDAVYA
jgi:CubicO group peptidase (beta-lactamase class C family)